MKHGEEEPDNINFEIRESQTLKNLFAEVAQKFQILSFCIGTLNFFHWPLF